MHATLSVSCAGLTRASMMPSHAALPYGLNSLLVIMDRRVKPGDDVERMSPASLQ